MLSQLRLRSMRQLTVGTYRFRSAGSRIRFENGEPEPTSKARTSSWTASVGLDLQGSTSCRLVKPLGRAQLALA